MLTEGQYGMLLKHQSFKMNCNLIYGYLVHGTIQWHEFLVILPSPNRALHMNIAFTIQKQNTCIWQASPAFIWGSASALDMKIWNLSKFLISTFLSTSTNSWKSLICFLTLSNVKPGCSDVIYKTFSTVNSVHFLWALFFIFKQSSKNFDRFRFKSKVLGKKRKGGKCVCE